MIPTSRADSPLLAAALGYAAAGWPIFPCAPRDKQPLVPSGFKDASTDPAIIRAWWHQWPAANIGLPIPAGMIALDIDPQHGGDHWYTGDGAALCPPTVTSCTGGGGLHLLYRVPDGMALIQKALAPGVDVRVAGKGYLIAPTSIHKTGRPYQWQAGAAPADRPVALAPWPLLTALAGAPEPTPIPIAPASVPWPSDHQRPSATTLIRLAQQRNAYRNDGGLHLACQLRDNGYSESEAERIMQEYQQQITNGADPYTRHEAHATLRSAYSRPARSPWARPAVVPLGSRPVADPAPEPWVDLHAAAVNADVDLLLNSLQEVLAERDALQAWKDKTLVLLFTKSDLEMSERVSLIMYEQIVEDRRLTPGAAPVIFPQDKIAAQCGISPATMGRTLGKWAAMGLVEYQVKPDPESPVLDHYGKPRLDKQGRPLHIKRTYLSCTRTAVAVAEVVVLAAALRENSRPPGGSVAGRRACPGCGADDATQADFVGRKCTGCGVVYQSGDYATVYRSDPAPGFHNEISKDSTDFIMKPEETAPPPLRATADDLRARAAEYPRVAAIVTGVRNRLATAAGDAAAGEYAHNRALADHCPPAGRGGRPAGG